MEGIAKEYAASRTVAPGSAPRIARSMRRTSENCPDRSPRGSLNRTVPPVSGAGSDAATAASTGAGTVGPVRVP